MANTSQKTRYGFYYFPDLMHYTEADIRTWMPELKALGATWLTLLTPTDRAIPETFIKSTIENGITPVLHMPFSTTSASRPENVNVIFKAYARWGVKYVVLFDRPNMIKNWTPSDWAKNNLVDRFLDIFIPIASEVIKAGLIPIFPPLQPGGDYWDTAFLFAALQGIQRRGQVELMKYLALSAYAWSGNRSPNWGAGGPERWPRTKPYHTPSDSEDHLGFRIFDWYLAINEAATGISRPILLLAGGSLLGNQIDPRSPAVDIHAHTWQNMTLIQLMSGQNREYEPVPPHVLCCNFWLLSAAEGSKEAKNSWYRPDRQQLPVVNQLKEWVKNGGAETAVSSKSYIPSQPDLVSFHPISHYLLLPGPEWSTQANKMDAIRPFINKFQPTIGFSPVEASHARRVTVISAAPKIPETIIDGLLAAGCIVEQINGDGMNIASQYTTHKIK